MCGHLIISSVKSGHEQLNVLYLHIAHIYYHFMIRKQLHSTIRINGNTSLEQDISEIFFCMNQLQVNDLKLYIELK